MTDIRPATPADRASLHAIAAASGLLSPEEVAFMEAGLDVWIAGETDQTWLIHDARDPMGAALLHPEPMSGDVWNMLFLATRPEGRRRGLARALIAGAEAHAADRGGRLMLVDTASADDFAPARAAYAAAGYAAEATIRDFYADGMHRVTFARRLA